jgi:hypothetical protein
MKRGSPSIPRALKESGVHRAPEQSGDTGDQIQTHDSSDEAPSYLPSPKGEIATTMSFP